MGEIVTLANRHMAAQVEYNARIQARYTIINLYLTGISVLIAVIFSHGEIHNQICRLSGKSECIQNQDLSLSSACAIVIPLATLICSLLMKMHDDMMGNLHSFMVVCEQQNNSNEELPSYHGNEPWADELLETRKLQECVMMVVFGVVCFCAMTELYLNFGGWSATVGAFISAPAFYFGYRSFKNRRKKLVEAKKIIGLKDSNSFPEFKCK